MGEGPLHVGIGNPMRQDDGVGPWIAERLAQRGQRARIWTADGAGLIDLFGTEPKVILIDATCSGATTGQIVRLNAIRKPLPRPFFRNSTHEFGLAEAVELARRLGYLPVRLEVIGVEGADFSHGGGLTQQVLLAARSVLKDLSRSR